MLKGDKINLRLMRKKDIEEYLDLFSDLETRGPYFPMALQTEASLEQRLAKDGCWSDEYRLLLIVAKDTDRILGMVVAFQPVRFYDAFEFGYILFDKASRGKGYVTEAVCLFVQYLFDLKPVHRIQLHIEAENLASVKVSEKCGFTFEGTARKAFIKSGKPTDIGIYSLLREEWEARKV
jgi:ribosomal-protein-alanine N-acetyltransferase